MTINTIVVGCGAVAQRLYRGPLRELERQGIVCVTRLVDRHLPNAEALASSFPRAAVHDDLEQTLKTSNPGLVLVLSPAQLHADHTLLALAYDNHVLCEKPMATTEALCAKMIAAAREKGRVLAIGMIRRFFPAFAQLREWIVRQEIGEIQSFCYREGKLFDWDVKTPAGFCKRKEGGAGLLFDIGSHAIDYLTWVFGAPTVLSYADDALEGVESNVFMELKTPVCVGTMQLSWDSPLKNELHVVGSEGEAILRVDQLDKLAIKTKIGFQEVKGAYQYRVDMNQPSNHATIPRLYTQSLYCQLIQVARAIRWGEEPAVGGEAGKSCVGILETALRHARPLDISWLNSAQRKANQTLHWTREQWDRSQSSERAALSAPVLSSR
ncbi:MAG TPA: Gfo/Idh/MocA family oxidoreductase [Gemmataceae bacterium]|jgi:predicted dehydrogenase